MGKKYVTRVLEGVLMVCQRVCVDGVLMEC